MGCVLCVCSVCVLCVLCVCEFVCCVCFQTQNSQISSFKMHQHLKMSIFKNQQKLKHENKTIILYFILWFVGSLLVDVGVLFSNYMKPPPKRRKEKAPPPQTEQPAPWKKEGGESSTTKRGRETKLSGGPHFSSWAVVSALLALSGLPFFLILVFFSAQNV